MENSLHLGSRIAAGDREAMAGLLMRHRSKILRRVRGKLRNARMQLVDAEDVFSSLARRMDDRCRTGRVIRGTEDDLVSYMIKAALNLASEKIRAQRIRRRALRRLWGDSSNRAPTTHDGWVEKAISWLLANLCEPDREVIQLRLLGVPHAGIAEELRQPMPGYRRRWRRVITRTRQLAHRADLHTEAASAGPSA